MSFSFDTSKAQRATTTGEVPAAGAQPSFSFAAAGGGDAAKPLATGFSLVSTPQNKPAAMFGTGLSTPPQNTGFSFTGTGNTSTPVVGTPLGAVTPLGQTPNLFGTPVPPSTGISFGATPSAVPSTGFPQPAAVGSTPGFSLGGAIATTVATPATGLSFDTTKRVTNPGFPLGGGEGAVSTPATGLTFGTPSTLATGTGFSLGGTPTSTTTSTTTTTATGPTGFSLAPTTTTLQPDAGFGTSTAPTTASTGFSLGGSATTSAGTGFSFGGGTTTSGVSLYKPTSAAPLSLSAPSTQISLGTTTTVTSAGTGTQPAAINFFQLEESINKWTLELEEQEKVFVNQASQINVWDKLLITNGEKIVTLNQEVERVKIEQQQLEHELDYVVGQQKELQDCLVPLEKELASLSISDPEREYTYRLSENLDTQLKQMSEDLKEIIEHLNEANRTQDSSDPIVQIGKILNAHMNSLQWLDQQTALLSQKIQQIDQMHQNFRQENERSFSLAYN